MSKDTITVELPIEAHNDVYVSVTGVVSVSREYWREVAANPNTTLNDMVRTVAPAVVAWIERDEWKPLDLPTVGRTIKATLRDGSVETFEVREVEDGYAWAWAYVWKVDSSETGPRYMQRTSDATDPHPTDIIAWEYVDEPAISVEQVEELSAALAHYDSEVERAQKSLMGPSIAILAGADLANGIRDILKEAGLVVAGESND